MKIAVRKELNGIIYIDKNLHHEINYTEEPYNFTIVDIDDKYSDCENIDFNNNLQFDVEKYNSRKLKDSAVKRIAELKSNLASTDYQAIKFAEGQLTEEEYAETKGQRQAWRVEINQLEKSLEEEPKGD